MAVEALQAQFPMFPSQACWNQLLSINLPACLRCLKASCTLSSPCVCLPTWPSAQHAHPRKATSINRGEEMLQPMATNASFRSIASWLSDNIASVSRNSFLCHASFWLQVKQRALWFAQLLSKPVTLDPCVLLYKVPVARLLKHSRHDFPQCILLWPERRHFSRRMEFCSLSRSKSSQLSQTIFLPGINMDRLGENPCPK